MEHDLVEQVKQMKEDMDNLYQLVYKHRHLLTDKTQKLVQTSITGTTSGFTAGAGTATKDDSTFTGGIGSRAYRISDIVVNLKNMGILAP